MLLLAESRTSLAGALFSQDEADERTSSPACTRRFKSRKPAKGRQQQQGQNTEGATEAKRGASSKDSDKGAKQARKKGVESTNQLRQAKLTFSSHTGSVTRVKSTSGRRRQEHEEPDLTHVSSKRGSGLLIFNPLTIQASRDASTVADSSSRLKFVHDQQDGTASRNSETLARDPVGGQEKGRASADTRPRADTNVWAEQFAPTQSAELAVHKDKVRELREWVLLNRQHLDQGTGRGQRVLVLRGPPGAGKTAMVRVVAAEVDMQVLEYRNGPGLNFAENKWVEMQWVSEVQELAAFLRAGQTFGGRTLLYDPATETRPESKSVNRDMGVARPALLLVEDVPYIHTAEQREVLVAAVRRVCLASRVLCIIVHSDSQEGGTSGRSDWPDCLLGLPALALIKINPVAVTFVQKALTRVLALAQLKVESATLSAIAKSADGDVRNAVNALQMWSLGQKKTSLNDKKKRKGAQKESSAAGNAVGDAGTAGTLCFGRDAGLTLFHSLGKILHNKRLPRPLPSLHSPAEPSARDTGDGDLRGPLSFVPEQVVAAAGGVPACIFAGGCAVCVAWVYVCMVSACVLLCAHVTWVDAYTQDSERISSWTS